MKLTCDIKAYIQPFERRLALLELERVAGARPQPISGDDSTSGQFEVETSRSAAEIAAAVAYWEKVAGTEKLFSTQVLREATVNIVRNGVPLDEIRMALPFESSTEVPTPNRRCLRYGTHGVHEYRGKFFPQLVRSLINLSGTGPGGIVADPMCGSGTTAVEGVLAGCHSLGADMNPLSVLMSRTKCAAINLRPDELTDSYKRVRSALLGSRARSGTSGLVYFRRLPSPDQQYLARWFSEEVLLDLDMISLEIERVISPDVRSLMLLSLSNVLRSVSWQKDADLRVRKEVRLDVEIDPVREFLEELGRTVRTVLAFLYQNEANTPGTYDIREASARDATAFWDTYVGKIDVVITSPPYATALPYLDTDRLSLSYLGLLPRPAQRKRDISMIGNREVNKQRREDYWNRFRTESDVLPSRVTSLIGTIHSLNAEADVGFRRKNLPALLAKYFFDMRDVLIQIHALLKPGQPAYVVVGNNHTTAGETRIEIATAGLLAEIADTVGLTPGDHIAMDMLNSRDIFKKNAISSEDILVLNKRP